MDFNVIKAENQSEWNAFLKKVESYDFYHTPSYHLLDKSGESVLLTFRDGDDCFGLPLIFRKITGTNWLDATSVYGYAGWIRTSQNSYPEVFDILQSYFEEKKIVSAFSRLHPIIKGSDHFLKGTVEDLNATFAIDLKLSPEEQLKSYSESVRRAIKKTKKEGVTIDIVGKDRDAEGGIADFIRIYSDAMDNLDALPQYYFSEPYFYSLLKSDDFESFIFFAKLDETIIGCALFVVCNGIMQYHLGAVVKEFRHLSPLKLIIDYARIVGIEKNISILHLGGGFGGADNNLSIFKSRMSGLTCSYKVWKWIVNESIYQELSANKPDTSFFPRYRC